MKSKEYYQKKLETKVISVRVPLEVYKLIEENNINLRLLIEDALKEILGGE